MEKIDYSQLIGLVADHVSGKLPSRKGNIVTTRRNLFRYRYEDESPKTFGQIKREICEGVWKGVVMANTMAVDPSKVEKDPLSAERVVLGLKKNDSFRGEIKYSRGHFDVRLENSRYRIYKRPEGFAALPETQLGGTGILELIKLKPEDFAVIIEDFDSHIPEMIQKAEEVYQEHKAELFEIQKEKRAAEIRTRTVQALEEQFLKPLGIELKYQFNADGSKVKLGLSKTLELQLDIPVEQLAAPLRDTESIISQMK